MCVRNWPLKSDHPHLICTLGPREGAAAGGAAAADGNAGDWMSVK